MSQIDDYIELRKKYKSQRNELYKLSLDMSLPKADRYKYRTKYNHLSDLISDLDDQIKGLDPSILNKIKKKTTRVRSGKSNAISLDNNAYRDSTKNRSLHEMFGFSDNYNFTSSPIPNYMKEAVQYLSPSMATAIDLYYNKCYSKKKIAEVMNLKYQSQVNKFIKRGLNIIYFWIYVRIIVDRCSSTTLEFDWDKFLDKITILAPSQLDIFLTLLDSRDDELTQPTVFSDYMNRSKNNSALKRDIGKIKGILEMIYIPIDDINNVHPLMKRYESICHKGYIQQMMVNSGYKGIPNNPKNAYDNIRDIMIG